MLELTGQRADGWLPSLFLLDAEPAYRALERVRAAATRAGRDPNALTYAMNVGVLIAERAAPQHGQLTRSGEQVAEKLFEFVEHGFATFVFWLSDDSARPDGMRPFVALIRPRVATAARWIRR